MKDTSLGISGLVTFLFFLIIVAVLARVGGETPLVTLILAGMIVGSVFSALVGILKYIAEDAALREIVFGLMGGFYFATMNNMPCAKFLLRNALFAILIFTEVAGAKNINRPTGYRVVIDHRGVSVVLPKEINRVVTISDGLVESVMTVFDVQHKIVGIGSPGLSLSRLDHSETVSGKRIVTKSGMNTVTFLNPWLTKLPLIARPGTGINYEALMALKPDVLIIQLGACALLAGDEKTRKNMGIIHTLGVPTIVLRGPNTCDEPRLTMISDQIRIIGEVFGKQQQATALATCLEKQVRFVSNRTQDIDETQKPRVLMMGLAFGARSSGGISNVRGINTSDSWILEKVVNARNAYSRPGIWNVLSTEQLLTLNPDWVLLITSQGYHPPSELYETPYYQCLSEMTAVKNHFVTALPFTPCNCEKRIEYPIDIMIMAKAAYPERFTDVRLGEWVLNFYQRVYKVDRDTAKGLRSAQCLDWTEGQ